MHHFRHRSAPHLDKLHVITPITNPERYKSRYSLFHRFKKAMETAGVNLHVVEIALGDRPYEVTEPDHPHHVQLQTWDQLWHKENQINVCISRLPSDWEYVAWIDADVEFLRQDWAEETCHLLQQYHVIQMFQNAIDLGPEGEVLQVHSGFVWSWMQGLPSGSTTMGYYSAVGAHYHPGYAWAARREAVDYLGGLYDRAILGAADHHMAWALIGKVDKSIPGTLSPGYVRTLKEWEARANLHIRQDIGYMQGTLQHGFHGKKKDRRYRERWDIIRDHKYDPDADLKHDWQGLWQFTHAGERMRNDLRAYMRARNEDSIDI